MRFKIPQYIDTEDKLIWSISIKQFLYLVACAGVLILLWTQLTYKAFLIISAPIALFFLALAFYKINGQPLLKMIAAIFTYYSQPKTYVWKRKNKRIE